MQDYLQLMTTSMELKGFAKSTQKTYLAHLRRFAEFSGKHPAAAGFDDVRAFLHHAISDRKLSLAYVNSAYGAIKFFFQTALCREWNMLHVPNPEGIRKRYFRLSPLRRELVPGFYYFTGIRVILRNFFQYPVLGEGGTMPFYSKNCCLLSILLSSGQCITTF